jgi:hypothetical protein
MCTYFAYGLSHLTLTINNYLFIVRTILSSETSVYFDTEEYDDTHNRLLGDDSQDANDTNSEYGDAIELVVADDTIPTNDRQHEDDRTCLSVSSLQWLSEQQDDSNPPSGLEQKLLALRDALCTTDPEPTEKTKNVHLDPRRI